jgi:hypothetical protein
MPKGAAGRSYLALLVAIVFVLVAQPALRGPVGSPLLARASITAVFLAGGWVVFARSRVRILAVLLGGAALLGVWLGYALPDRRDPIVAACFHLSAMVFQVLVLAVLLLGVHRERTVSADAVAAALCGYLLIGVAFGHAFCLLDEVVPWSFNGLDGNRNESEKHFLLTYFSFVTLTTVGYGDITPAKDTARSLALVEAVTGQFYLAVLVADLVGKRVAQALAPESPLRE